MPISGNPRRQLRFRWLIVPTMLALVLASFAGSFAFATHDDGEHSGRAIAVQADATVLDVVAATVTLCDTGELNVSGQPLEDCQVAEASGVAGPVTVNADLLTGETEGDGATSETTSTIIELDAAVAALLAVSARVIASVATASCDTEGPALDTAGGTTFSELVITLLGEEVAVDLAVGGAQVFVETDLLGNETTLTVVVGERFEQRDTRANGDEFGDITVTALRITLIDELTDTEVELILAESHADILCPAVPPTDAPPTDVPPTDAPPTLPDSVATPPAPSAPSGSDHGNTFLLLLIGTAVAAAWLFLQPRRRRDQHPL